MKITKIAMFLLLVLELAPMAVGDVHQGVPPSELWGFHKGSTAEFNNGVRGDVEFNANLKKLWCRWRLNDEVVRTQNFATSYYPTAVLTLAPTKWLVAGKSVRGATVIELWTVQKPLVIQGQNQGGTPSVTLATVSQIDSMYDESTEGRDMVMNMCPKLGASNVVLVHFYDSKDIYELDLTTQAYTLVASPATQASGVLLVPEINAVWEEFWSGEHVSRGYVYVLACTGTSRHPVMLEDSDKDGNLDLYVESTYSIWSSTYGSESNWVQ